MTSFLRPVAFTAATNSMSSQALMLVRSMEVALSIARLRVGTVSGLTPDWTPTVVRIIGRSNNLAVSTTAMTFESSCELSMDRTVFIWGGW